MDNPVVPVLSYTDPPSQGLGGPTFHGKDSAGPQLSTTYITTEVHWVVISAHSAPYGTRSGGYSHKDQSIPQRQSKPLPLATPPPPSCNALRIFTKEEAHCTAMEPLCTYMYTTHTCLWPLQEQRYMYMIIYLHACMAHSSMIRTLYMYHESTRLVAVTELCYVYIPSHTHVCTHVLCTM